jgi:threonine/homoserine/homoserine lactone efflux protein
MLSSASDHLMNGEPNLTTTERGAYMAAGLGLAAVSLKPRPNPLLNVLALLGGSYLAWRGYVGNCPVKAALFDASSSSGRIAHRG